MDDGQGVGIHDDLIVMLVVGKNGKGSKMVTSNLWQSHFTSVLRAACCTGAKHEQTYPKTPRCIGVVVDIDRLLVLGGIETMVGPKSYLLKCHQLEEDHCGVLQPSSR